MLCKSFFHRPLPRCHATLSLSCGVVHGSHTRGRPWALVTPHRSIADSTSTESSGSTPLERRVDITEAFQPYSGHYSSFTITCKCAPRPVAGGTAAPVLGASMKKSNAAVASDAALRTERRVSPVSSYDRTHEAPVAVPRSVPDAGRTSSTPLGLQVAPASEPVKRVIFIRSGAHESMKQSSVLLNTPDWRLPLLPEGAHRMRALGKQLAEELQNETLYLYHSPYRRARASLHEWLTGYVSAKKGKPPVLPSSPPPEEDTYQWEYEVDTIQGLREDSRLRGGDMGRYDSIEEMKSHFCEQQRYGPFFYRFPHGESGADVCDRVTSFLSTFQRERSELRPETNVLIFTHDIVIRMFIKRWFHLTVDTFHQMAPVASGSVCVLSRVDGHSYFRLDEASVAAMHLPRSLNDSNGYRFRNKDFLGSMSLGAPFM